MDLDGGEIYFSGRLKGWALKSRLFWAQMALAAIVAISEPTPSNGSRYGFPPIQVHTSRPCSGPPSVTSLLFVGGNLGWVQPSRLSHRQVCGAGQREVGAHRGPPVLTQTCIPLLLIRVHWYLVVLHYSPPWRPRLSQWRTTFFRPRNLIPGLHLHGRWIRPPRPTMRGEKYVPVIIRPSLLEDKIRTIRVCVLIHNMHSSGFRPLSSSTRPPTSSMHSVT